MVVWPSPFNPLPLPPTVIFLDFSLMLSALHTFELLFFNKHCLFIFEARQSWINPMLKFLKLCTSNLMHKKYHGYHGRGRPHTPWDSDTFNMLNVYGLCTKRLKIKASKTQPALFTREVKTWCTKHLFNQLFSIVNTV